MISPAVWDTTMKRMLKFRFSANKSALPIEDRPRCYDFIDTPFTFRPNSPLIDRQHMEPAQIDSLRHACVLLYYRIRGEKHALQFPPAPRPDQQHLEPKYEHQEDSACAIPEYNADEHRTQNDCSYFPKAMVNPTDAPCFGNDKYDSGIDVDYQHSKTADHTLYHGYDHDQPLDGQTKDKSNQDFQSHSAGKGESAGLVPDYSDETHMRRSVPSNNPHAVPENGASYHTFSRAKCSHIDEDVIEPCSSSEDNRQLTELLSDHSEKEAVPDHNFHGIPTDPFGHFDDSTRPSKDGIEKTMTMDESHQRRIDLRKTTMDRIGIRHVKSEPAPEESKINVKRTFSTRLLSKINPLKRPDTKSTTKSNISHPGTASITTADHNDSHNPGTSSPATTTTMVQTPIQIAHSVQMIVRKLSKLGSHKKKPAITNRNPVAMGTFVEAA